MSGIAQTDTQARQNLFFLVVGQTLEQFHGLFRVIARKKRRDRRQSFPLALFILPLCIFFMQVTGITKHDVA
jgi:hypothetical protein